jgi:formyltetrahydrofolate deformylase
MTSFSNHKTYVLTMFCADAVGIVAAVAGFLAGLDLFITESAHYGDTETGRFFIRTVFVARPDQPGLEAVQVGFSDVADRFGMSWEIHDAAVKPRVMILVSKFDHCLNDLLYRYRTGALPIDIVAVVSNHPDLMRVVEWHGVPFHHLPVSKESKASQEGKILELATRLNIDLVILARYMQILSADMCRAVAWRAINIHHSFLPSFKGARPYHQAHARGVKIIGATAHYVTTDLDEGPIIEQEVERIDHTYTAEDFIAIGRDIENVVLSRAVKFHVERRVIPNGAKTVVFKR